MRINHNIAALNTYNKLSSASNAQSKSMEKLASGQRINRAGDDAAGLAISEKMRAQVRGLDQASRNSQDGISMLQTAEGALNETHDILQRMRELATQAASDTNVGVDRNEIQKEINQLSSEINRVGNTTEFNTQSLLKGDGGVGLSKTGIVSTATAMGTSTKTQATATNTVTTAAAAGDTFKLQFGGKEFNHTFAATPADIDATGAELRAALTSYINSDESLKGQFTVSGTNGAVTLSAVAGGTFDGAEGKIAAATGTGTIIMTSAAGVGTTTNTAATSNVDFTSILKTATGAVDKTSTATAIKDLIGKGFEINGQKIEFYNVNDGAYKGEAFGVDISKALDATTNAVGNAGALAGDTAAIQNAFTKAVADQVGTKLSGVTITAGAGANQGKLVVNSVDKGTDAQLEIKDGAVKKEFEATFQVGANKNQSFSIDINDMRSEALGITGKAGSTGFTKNDTVTDGTSSTNKEAALDVSTHTSASAAIETINKAIETVSSERSKLGAFQNRLEHTINNLNTSSENLTAAESRIRDVDYALAA
ncbi:flagellin N-terminal helical domain-containing protein [Metabacillus indicus]|uniref:Flagellin n=1 Tax=Metabacillus indicus TaxID=246786 RepID=A0A084GXS9_METID|nr:flagellin [Metabacillus indicus]KEZ52141.1 hypothetical protein GS18_0213750 [Metabacillus indicus]